MPSKCSYCLDCEILSVCQGGTKKQKTEFRKNLFQKIYSLVQPESILFLMDCPDKGVIEICGGVSKVLPEHHITSLRPTPRFTQKWTRPHLKCTTSFTTSCSVVPCKKLYGIVLFTAWQKTEILADRHQRLLEGPLREVRGL
ncbi:hypothetical protein CEXT_268001, partial [Caerostris extrusa]